MLFFMSLSTFCVPREGSSVKVGIIDKTDGYWSPEMACKCIINFCIPSLEWSPFEVLIVKMLFPGCFTYITSP